MVTDVYELFHYISSLYQMKIYQVEKVGMKDMEVMWYASSSRAVMLTWWECTFAVSGTAIP